MLSVTFIAFKCNPWELFRRSSDTRLFLEPVSGCSMEWWRSVNNTWHHGFQERLENVLPLCGWVDGGGGPHTHTHTHTHIITYWQARCFLLSLKKHKLWTLFVLNKTTNHRRGITQHKYNPKLYNIIVKTLKNTHTHTHTHTHTED